MQRWVPASAFTAPHLLSSLRVQVDLLSQAANRRLVKRQTSREQDLKPAKTVLSQSSFDFTPEVEKEALEENINVSERSPHRPYLAQSSSRFPDLPAPPGGLFSIKRWAFAAAPSPLMRSARGPTSLCTSTASRAPSRFAVACV